MKFATSKSAAVHPTKRHAADDSASSPMPVPVADSAAVANWLKLLRNERWAVRAPPHVDGGLMVAAAAGACAEPRLLLLPAAAALGWYDFRLQC